MIDFFTLLVLFISIILTSTERLHQNHKNIMYTLHTHAKLVQKKSLSLLGANNNILTFLREQFFEVF